MWFITSSVASLCIVMASGQGPSKGVANLLQSSPSNPGSKRSCTEDAVEEASPKRGRLAEWVQTNISDATKYSGFEILCDDDEWSSHLRLALATIKADPGQRHPFKWNDLEHVDTGLRCQWKVPAVMGCLDVVPPYDSNLGPRRLCELVGPAFQASRALEVALPNSGSRASRQRLPLVWLPAHTSHREQLLRFGLQARTSRSQRLRARVHHERGSSRSFLNR